ncbi:MAG: hypothetical protein ACOYED_01355 [Peptococcia bacterium]|jgi:hypothetical protein
MHYAWCNYRDMSVLRKPEIMQVLREIDQDIESTVRGPYYYNKYLKQSEEIEQIDHLEEQYTKYCFESKYNSRLKELGLSQEQIEQCHVLMLYEQSCFKNVTRYSVDLNPYYQDDFMKIEKALDNAKRLQILEEVNSEREAIRDNGYYANTTVNRLNHNYFGSGFYSVHNSPEENAVMLKYHLQHINFSFGKEDSPAKQSAIQAAKDYHVVRTEGANTPPEVMERLVKYERNRALENQGRIIAVVKLGEMNKELGIIPQPRAAEVFPEYESVKRDLAQFKTDIESGKFNELNQFTKEDREERDNGWSERNKRENVRSEHHKGEAR